MTNQLPMTRLFGAKVYKFSIWAVLLIVSFLRINTLQTAESSERDFADDQERVIRAKVVLVKNGKVHFKRNGQVFQFPFSKLSEKDQEYLRKWVASNAKYWFSFDAKVVDDPSKTVTKGSGRNKASKTFSHYLVEVVNRSGVPVKDVQVKYMVALQAKMDGKINKRTLTFIDGEAVIPSLENTKRMKLHLKEITLVDAKWVGSQSYSMRNQSGVVTTGKVALNKRISFVLDGIWIKLYINGSEIAEYKSEEKSIQNAAWGWGQKKENIYNPDGYEDSSGIYRFLRRVDP